MNFKLKVWRQKDGVSSGSFKDYDAKEIPSEASFLDVCSLKTAADLPVLMDGIQTAVADASPSVVGLIRRLGLLGKPLHFQLPRRRIRCRD